MRKATKNLLAQRPKRRYSNSRKIISEWTTWRPSDLMPISLNPFHSTRSENVWAVSLKSSLKAAIHFIVYMSKVQAKYSCGTAIKLWIHRLKNSHNICFLKQTGKRWKLQSPIMHQSLSEQSHWCIEIFHSGHPEVFDVRATTKRKRNSTIFSMR